jgi:hypothetical protein
MAPEEGRRLFKFLRKPLLLFPCCGSSSHVTAPVSRNAVAPEQPEDSAQSRQDRFRPAKVAVAEEPLSKSEDASDSHPYHCPICFYYFAGTPLSHLPPHRGQERASALHSVAGAARSAGTSDMAVGPPDGAAAHRRVSCGRARLAAREGMRAVTC